VSRLRLAVVLAGVLVLQRTVAAVVSVHDVHPDLVLAYVVGVGVLGGPVEGALAGFVAGLAADLFVETPFGLSALAYTLVGYAVGRVQSSVSESGRVLLPVVTATASAAGMALYAVLGAVVGEPEMLHAELVWIVLVVAAVNGLVARPMVRVLGWAALERSGRAEHAGGRVR
jgi:rod shape-determining protein MreD